MKFLSVILLSLALIIETTLTTFPFVFLILLIIAAIYKNSFVFLLSFVFGVLLDMFTFKTIGFSSIFLVIFTFLVLLYQSKLEISTNRFIVVATFLGSFCFLLISGNTHSIILESLLSSFIGLIFFVFIKKLSFTEQPTK